METSEEIEQRIINLKAQISAEEHALKKCIEKEDYLKNNIGELNIIVQANQLHKLMCDCGSPSAKKCDSYYNTNDYWISKAKRLYLLARQYNIQHNNLFLIFEEIYKGD